MSSPAFFHPLDNLERCPAFSHYGSIRRVTCPHRACGIRLLISSKIPLQLCGTYSSSTVLHPEHVSDSLFLLSVSPALCCTPGRPGHGISQLICSLSTNFISYLGHASQLLGHSLYRGLQLAAELGTARFAMCNKMGVGAGRHHLMGGEKSQRDGLSEGSVAVNIFNCLPGYISS